MTQDGVWGSPEPGNTRTLEQSLYDAERKLILDAIEMYHRNWQQTVKLVDINRTTQYKKIKRYRLQK